MDKKTKEVIDCIKLILAAFAMVAAAVGLIYLISIVFHTNFK